MLKKAKTYPADGGFPHIPAFDIHLLTSQIVTKFRNHYWLPFFKKNPAYTTACNLHASTGALEIFCPLVRSRLSQVLPLCSPCTPPSYSKITNKRHKHLPGEAQLRTIRLQLIIHVIKHYHLVVFFNVLRQSRTDTSFSS